MIADKDFVLNEMGSEYVLTCTDPKKFGGMIRINASGAFIWRHLESETTAEALLDAALEAFDAPRETQAKDLDEFLSALSKVGAVHA